MCFYYQLSAKAQKLESRYNKTFPNDSTFQKQSFINAFEFPATPIIINNQNRFVFYNWGLIPHWANNNTIKKYTLNARIETLSEKPSFKNIIHQRCLIPATGFYEWKWLDSKGKNKEKYLIQNKEQTVFSFAGLYSIWVDNKSNQTHNTFTILTTQANPLMAEIHHTKKRMPVILEKEDESAWLSGKDYTSFAFPYSTKLMAQALSK